jgi:hypothetical protein
MTRKVDFEGMPNKWKDLVSRRAVLKGLAATAASGAATAGPMVAGMAAENDIGPVFSPSGPNGELYGAAENYPFADPALAHQPGVPLEPKYRVGAFSHGARLVAMAVHALAARHSLPVPRTSIFAD